MNELNDKLCAYLKAGNFITFMEAWKNQIERYGHVGGTISIALTQENRSYIAELMGKDYHRQSHAKIAWSALKKVINNSCFEGADFNDVVCLYFNEVLISRKSRKAIKEEEVQDLFISIYKQYSSTFSEKWLQSIQHENNNVMLRFRQEALNKNGNLKKQFCWALEAINHLPCWNNKRENIAIFASQITSDPHALDHGSLASYFLVQGICFYKNIRLGRSSGLERNEILLQAGLYRDSVSNFCAIAHVNALINESECHPGWEGFYRNYEAWNVHMDNLNEITKIDSKNCSAVAVVENPSVFQFLVYHAKLLKKDTIGFVCTYGQLNACGYTLLDKIYEANIMMYYSGDLDPEGLLIADKLKQRYQNKLCLWRYSILDYNKSKSNKQANAKRMKILDLLKSEELIELAMYLKIGCLGYQENLLDEYLQDLKEL